MKILALNKKASFDYDFVEKFESGIVLTGAEVKSISSGQISLKDSYVKIIKSEAYLWNAHVSHYKFSPKDKMDEYRSRKLLLKKRELEKLSADMKKFDLTVIPLKIYSAKSGKIKLEIALAKGKKLFDKRSVIKERDQKRDILRHIKNESK